MRMSHSAVRLSILALAITLAFVVAVTANSGGPITGMGTDGRLARFTGPSTIGNSIVREASSTIGVGINSDPRARLLVGGTTAVTANTSGAIGAFIANQNGSAPIADFRSNRNNVRMVVQSDGNVGIGTTSPASLLEVAGTIHTSSGGILFPDGSLQGTAALEHVTFRATFLNETPLLVPHGVVDVQLNFTATPIDTAGGWKPNPAGPGMAYQPQVEGTYLVTLHVYWDLVRGSFPEQNWVRTNIHIQRNWTMPGGEETVAESPMFVHIPDLNINNWPFGQEVTTMVELDADDYLTFHVFEVNSLASGSIPVQTSPVLTWATASRIQ